MFVSQANRRKDCLIRNRTIKIGHDWLTIIWMVNQTQTGVHSPYQHSTQQYFIDPWTVWVIRSKACEEKGGALRPAYTPLLSLFDRLNENHPEYTLQMQSPLVSENMHCLRVTPFPGFIDEHLLWLSKDKRTQQTQSTLVSENMHCLRVTPFPGFIDEHLQWLSKDKRTKQMQSPMVSENMHCLRVTPFPGFIYEHLQWLSKDKRTQQMQSPLVSENVHCLRVTPFPGFIYEHLQWLSKDKSQEDTADTKHTGFRKHALSESNTISRVYRWAFTVTFQRQEDTADGFRKTCIDPEQHHFQGLYMSSGRQRL